MYFVPLIPIFISIFLSFISTLDFWYFHALDPNWMTQIEILSGYDIFPVFEDRALHTIEYNEWGHVSFSIYLINITVPLLLSPHIHPPMYAFCDFVPPRKPY